MRGLREVAGREGARPEPVDVLAVLDFRIDQAVSNWRYHGQDDGPEPDSIIVFRQARAAVAELIEAARAAEFHLTREHRAPMTVDAADYLTEVERDRNKLRAALTRVGSAGGAL